MKRICIFICFAVCLLGCNKTPIIDDNDNNPSEIEKIVVSLGLGGEITMSESPLSRTAGAETSSQDLYAINVYYDKNKDGNIRYNYAYGIFDNTNDMVITLLTGYKYKFECTYVPNGKAFSTYYNEIYKYGQSIFAIADKNGWSSTNPPIANEFVASEGLYFTNIKYGLCYNNNSEKYGPSNADRYYGQLDNYSPSVGEKAVIDMTRCAFGFKIIVSGLSDGTLSLGSCFGDSNSIWVSENGVAVDEIRAFRNVYDCWRSSQEYSVTESMSIKWTRGNGVTQDLGSQSITFKRNVLTTVNINLTGSSSDTGIGLNIMSGDMGDSSLNININADGTVDTNVDPQH